MSYEPALPKASVDLLIQDFMEREHGSMNWFQKISGTLPTIHDTEWYARSLKAVTFGPQKTIRPSLFHRTVLVVLIGFAFIFWLVFFRMVLQGVHPWPVVVGMLLFMSFIICLIIYNGFLKKEYNYTIRVDQEGLAVDERIFSWKDVAATCIMWWPGGKGGTNYLVIFTNDRTVEKYNIYPFSISAARMSSIIEYYKQQFLATR